MELKDFAVTPVVLIVIYLVAYYLRPRFTDEHTKRYFIPALTVRIVGAILLGIIYQYYYGYGDTFLYHSYGSRIIWEAFINDPSTGLELIFGDNAYSSGNFQYATRIPYFRYDDTYFVVRIAGFLDLFTFGSYAATASLFGAIGFSGIWALYTVFYRKWRHLHFYFALAILFLPSTVFWGSGILKDTITMAALGFLFYAVDALFSRESWNWKNILTAILSIYFIGVIKIYMLFCFIPALVIWILFLVREKIDSTVVKLLVLPIVFVSVVIFAIFSLTKLGEIDPKYSLENVSTTVRVTAYDIAFQTGRGAGSTYELGELDGSLLGTIRYLPEAINVALFRPYLWEVNNPFMLIASLESTLLLLLTIFTIFKSRLRLKFHSIVLFCLAFSLIFAFAVGVSTYNFGTLMRYKIPLVPFYLSALLIISMGSRDD